MQISELQPLNQKSFYGKALILTENNIIKLRSYTTIVAEYNTITKKLTLNGWYSMTTGRHINAFLYYLRLPTMTKKEIENHIN